MQELKLSMQSEFIAPKYIFLCLFDFSADDLPELPEGYQPAYDSTPSLRLVTFSNRLTFLDLIEKDRIMEVSLQV